uniref:response regulator transcription factor n=1 Tax=Faecalicatena contorta TaxID=39482 RepID=UPI00359C4BC9
MLMKILVAEDEPAIRQGIIALIENLGLSVEITGAAEDGMEALELMAATRPDVLITDIRMPGMSGLELIGKAKELYPGTEYVILSGYSEFEYAKQAMRYGVQDYILKPPRKEEVGSALEKIYTRMANSKKAGRKQNVYDYVVNGVQKDTAQLETEGCCYYLILFCIGPFTNRTENLIQVGINGFSSKELQEQLCQGLREGEECLVFDMKQQNEKLILLSVKKREISPIQRVVLKLSSYEKKFSMPVHMILSDEMDHTGLLPGTYAKLHRSLARQVLIGKSDVVFLEKESNQESELALDESEKCQIASLLEQGDGDGLCSLFGLLCTKWKKKRIPQISCEFSVKYILMEVYQRNPVLEAEAAVEDLFYQAEEVIGKARTFEQFEEGICGLFQDVFGRIKEGKANKKIEDVVELLKQHIYLHYNSNLSLEKFAGQFGYNPTYLSNQFTSLQRISPSRLLTNIRLEKGKELLLNTDYLLKDIAEMIGFHDVSYFSRFFKDNVGQSPKQFREAAGRERKE